MRFVIALIFYVIAAAMMRDPQLYALADFKWLTVPVHDRPALLLGLYTLLIFGLGMGTVRHKVKFDLSMLTKENAAKLAASLGVLIAVPTAPVLAKLAELRMAMTDVVSLAGEAKAGVEQSVVLHGQLQRIAALRIGDNVRAVQAALQSIDTLRGLGPVPQIEDLLDDMDTQIALIKKIADDHDLDEVKDHVDKVVEIKEALDEAFGTEEAAETE
jgi:hypothetical protein